MAFSEELAHRVREMLANDVATEAGIEERKMFGGISFMLRGHYCCGVLNDDLMVRGSPQAHDEQLAEPHAREMDFTRRVMRGWVYIAPEGTDDDEALAKWVTAGVEHARSLPAR